MLRMIVRGIAALLIVFNTAAEADELPWDDCMGYLHSPILFLVQSVLSRTLNEVAAKDNVVACRNVKVKEKTTMIVLLERVKKTLDEPALADAAGRKGYRVSLRFLPDGLEVYTLEPPTDRGQRFVMVRGKSVVYKGVLYPLTVVFRGRFNTAVPDTDIVSYLAHLPNGMLLGR